MSSGRTRRQLTPRVPALAPFGQRNFRLQWPADLATSWAFEMETLLLGRFILVKTLSVIALTAFGALQFIGTLLSPFLMSAMAIEQCSADLARIAGALIGAGLAAALGMTVAYVAVTAPYLASFTMTALVREAHAPRAAPTTPWRDLGAGLSYVRRMPPLMAAQCLAFLVYFLAYPLTGGLLPFVARDIYGTNQQALSLLLAGFSGGALAGSVSLSIFGPQMPPGRTAWGAAMMWFPLLLLFARLDAFSAGFVLLVVSVLCRATAWYR